MKEMESEKKTKKLAGITFTGDITVHGDMFNIHDNQHVHITRNGKGARQEDEDFEYVDLVFFDVGLFGTYERQLGLRNVLKDAFKRMQLDTGRDLIAVFIAYHFLKNKLLNMKCYTDFLQDVEGLMPGMLPKIKEDENNRSLRYKSYAESLALECEKWFIDEGCLPDKTVWKSKDYNYNVDDERRKRIQSLVTKILQGMSQFKQ
jgi:hypothetical protein